MKDELVRAFFRGEDEAKRRIYTIGKEEKVWESSREFVGVDLFKSIVLRSFLFLILSLLFYFFVDIINSQKKKYEKLGYNTKKGGNRDMM